MRRIFLAILLFSVLGGVGPSIGQSQTQTQTVDRAVKALPNKDTQIGLYVNVLADCSSGPLPTIRLVSPPNSGKVVVRASK